MKEEDSHGSKKKKHSTNRLLVIAMAVFVGICSFKIVGTQMKISEKQYQLKQLEQSIEEQQKINQELENQLEKARPIRTKRSEKRHSSSMDMGIRMSISTSTVRQAEQIFEEDVGIVCS